jgi:hypothetical protein
MPTWQQKEVLLPDVEAVMTARLGALHHSHIRSRRIQSRHEH